MPNNNFSQQGDSELAKQSQSGNQTAFAELIKRYQQMVRGFIYHKIGDYQDAEQLTQEVFCRVLNSIYGKRRFNLTAKFTTWLFRIVQNICIDWYKKKRLKPVEPDKNKEDIRTRQPDKETAEKEIITDCLDKLPDEQKTIIILYGQYEFSFREIGKILSKPESTVKEIYYEKAKPQFQNCLKAKGVDL